MARDIRFSFGFMCLAMGAALGALGEPALAQNFDGIDRKIAAAAAETKAGTTLERVAALESELKKLASDPAFANAQSELSTRALIANSLAAISRLEEQQQVLEAVRLCVRTLDFAHSLHELAKTTGGGDGPVASLVDAMWQRTARIAKADRNAKVVYTSGPGEVIVRTFLASEKGVSAWELIGDAATKRARWRESVVAQVPASELAAIDQELPAVLQGNKGRDRAPFLLVVGGIASSATPSVEAKLAKVAVPYFASGIVTVAAANGMRPWPYRWLPAVNNRADGATLIHRGSGRRLFSWRAPSTAGELTSILDVAAELTAEASADLKWPAPQTPILAAEDLASPAPSPVPVTKQPALLAVRDATVGGGWDDDTPVSLTSESPLTLSASLGAWGAYRTKDEKVVWLRKSAVGSYVPPLPPNPLPAARTSGGVPW